MQSHITGVHQESRPDLDLSKSSASRQDQDFPLVLLIIIELVRLRFCSSRFSLSGFDDFALNGWLVVLGLSFLVALIVLVAVFLVFFIRLSFTFAVFFIVVDHNALLGLVGVGVRDGGFGALGTRVGGGVGRSGGLGAGFALFGRGSCGIDQSVLSLKDLMVKVGTSRGLVYGEPTIFLLLLFLFFLFLLLFIVLVLTFFTF
jgi:hypothetical protein